MFAEKAISPISITLALLACALAGGAEPARADVSWQLRFGATWLDPDGESTQPLTSGLATTDVDSGVGITATAEVRFSDRVGLEFGVLTSASPDLEVQIADGSVIRDELDIVVLGGGLNFHLTPDSPVDLWIGPFVGQAYFSDLLFIVDDDDATFIVDDEPVVGAVIGIDVPFDERWFFTGHARYMAFDIDPESATGDEAQTIGLDTLAVSAGVGFRF